MLVDFVALLQDAAGEFGTLRAAPLRLVLLEERARSRRRLGE